MKIRVGKETTEHEWCYGEDYKQGLLLTIVDLNLVKAQTEVNVNVLKRWTYMLTKCNAYIRKRSYDWR